MLIPSFRAAAVIITVLIFWHAQIIWRNGHTASALVYMQGMAVHAESAVDKKRTALHGVTWSEVLVQFLWPDIGCMCRALTIAQWDWSCASDVREHFEH